MEQTIIWFITQIINLVTAVLSWKILGDFSILHLVLGFNFLIILFTFFKFGIETGGESAVIGANDYRNSENKRQREEYKKTYEYYSSNRAIKESYKNRYDREMKHR